MSCAECLAEEPRVYCMNCNASFCEPCFDAVHDRRSLKNHSFVLVSDLMKMPVQCEVHKEPLKLFSKNERVPICAMCAVIGDYKGHDIITIEDAAAFIRSEIDEIRFPLNTMIDGMKSRLGILNECREVLHEQIDHARNNIDDSCENLIKYIREYQSHVHALLDEARNKELDTIAAEEEHFQDASTKAYSYLEGIDHGSDENVKPIEVAQFWNEIHEKLQDFIKGGVASSHLDDSKTYEDTISEVSAFPTKGIKELEKEAQRVLADKWTHLFQQLNSLEERHLGSVAYEIGWSYFEGRHTFDKDKSCAADWYNYAANLGSSSGLNSLGFCYEAGVGRQASKQEAANCYRKAANMGHVDAMWNLGLCYEFGKGVPKDLMTALKWYVVAAEYSYDRAQERLQEYASTSVEIPKLTEEFERLLPE